MVPARLDSPLGSTGDALARTGDVRDLGRASEFSRDHDHHASSQSPFEEILDQRRHRLVVERATVLEALEDVVVDRVVVPVADPPTQGSVEGRRDQVHSRFDKPPGQQGLLAPTVSTVAVTRGGSFFLQVEGPLGGRTGQHVQRLGLELVERLHLVVLVGVAAESIQASPQPNPLAHSRQLLLVAEPDVGHLESAPVGIAGDGKRFVGRPEVGRARIGHGVHSDVVGQSAVGTPPQAVHDREQVGMIGFLLENPDRVAGQQLLGSLLVAEPGVDHRSQQAESVRHFGMMRQQFADPHSRGLGGDGIVGTPVGRTREWLGIVGLEVAGSAL